MLSLRNAFCGLVLLVAQVFAAAPLAFKYPTHPEANTNFTISWSGGVSPYLIWVLTPDLQDYWWTYNGPDTSKVWDFDITAGTVIVFKAIDNTGAFLLSPNITLLSPPELFFPTGPQSGISSSIRWTGGFPPYKAAATSVDGSTTYWTYSGTALTSNWDFNVTAGTNVVFSVTDANNVKISSDTVQVLGNPATVSLSQQSVLSQSSIILQSSLSVESLASLASVSSTSLASNTNTGTATNTQTGTSSTTSTSSSSSPSTSHKSSSNTGAIAGGVVGGVIGLALIAGVAWLIHRRSNSAMGYGAAAREPSSPNSFPPMSETPHSPESSAYAPGPGSAGYQQTQYNGGGYPPQNYGAPQDPRYSQGTAQMMSPSSGNSVHNTASFMQNAEIAHQYSSPTTGAQTHPAGWSGLPEV